MRPSGRRRRASGLVALRAQPGEAGLQEVVDRGRGEHRRDDPAGRGRLRAQRDEPERAPRAHAARAAQQLADGVAQAPALRPPAVRALLDERRAHPGLHLLVHDELGQREGGRRQRQQVARRELEAPAAPRGCAGQRGEQAGVGRAEQGVVRAGGRGLLDGSHQIGRGLGSGGSGKGSGAGVGGTGSAGGDGDGSGRALGSGGCGSGIAIRVRLPVRGERPLPTPIHILTGR